MSTPNPLLMGDRVLLSNRGAYRTARSEAHPDKGGSEEAFLAVQAAYEAAARELGFTP